jgi:Peptidase A4 family
MLRRWCIPLAGLALVIGSAATTATAAAAGHVPRATHTAAAGQLVRPTIHLIRPTGPRPMISHGFPHTAATSLNWSGYAATGRKFRSVSASWTEPKAHCSGSGHKFAAFWVGIDGANSGTVEQTGSDADCVGSHPRYFAWYEMFPAFPVNFANRVRPGDHFSASVTHNSGSKYTLVIKDHTQHWSHIVHKSLRGAKNSSAEIIAEAPSTGGGKVLPLANFGTMHFSNAKANGSAISHSRAFRIVMINNARRPKDAVSSLSHGENFTVKWKHST